MPTNIFILYLVYVCRTYLNLLFNKKERIEHIEKQKRLEVLRDIKYKTFQQQKEFIDLKYPKTDPFKWSLKNVFIKILYLVLYILFFICIRFLWKTYVGFNISWIWLFVIMIFLPIMINTILKKYNLHRDDVRVYFKKIPKQ